MFINILLALHLVGLMMGAGGGFGSMITMREASARPPEQAAVLKTLGPAMAQFSAIGLGLMLASGIVLVFAKYGGVAALPALFWAKMIFVAALTLASIFVHITYGQIRVGNFAAAARLQALGPLAGASSVISVIVAVFAFH